MWGKCFFRWWSRATPRVLLSRCPSTISRFPSSIWPIFSLHQKTRGHFSCWELEPCSPFWSWQQRRPLLQKVQISNFDSGSQPAAVDWIGSLVSLFTISSLVCRVHFLWITSLNRLAILICSWTRKEQGKEGQHWKAHGQKSCLGSTKAPHGVYVNERETDAKYTALKI